MQGKLCCTKREHYDKQLFKLERRVLEFLPRVSELKTRNYDILILDPLKEGIIHNTWIRCHTLMHHENKTEVVFLHGFGGSTCTYLTFFNQLSKHYSVHSIDLLGMGCSGKPDISWEKLNEFQAVDIMVKSIEQWRAKIGIEKINFVGHSLGSLFSLAYAKQYPQRVGSIIGMSTPCVAPEPVEFDASKLKLPLKRKMMKWFWTFMNKKYIKGHTAFSMMPLRTVINFWLNGRQSYSEEQKKAVTEFLSVKIWDKHFSSDIIPVLMGYLGYAKEYIVTDVLQEVMQIPDIKVKIYFGDKDWLDYKLFKKAIDALDIGIETVVLKDIGHQIPNLIPTKIADIVAKDFKEFDI